MKHIKTAAKRGRFDLLAKTRGAQAAKMTLRPGAASDDEPSNEHAQSEQWLFVLAGTGEVKIGRRNGSMRSLRIGPNSLVLIEKGELHQITNAGRSELSTLNFYIPPAYDNQGEPL
jgi:mannose-6-phosphate isomerase-like protein (cupin superfamily)